MNVKLISTCFKTTQTNPVGLRRAYLILHNCSIQYVSQIKNVREIYCFNVWSCIENTYRSWWWIPAIMNLVTWRWMLLTISLYHILHGNKYRCIYMGKSLASPPWRWTDTLSRNIGKYQLSWSKMSASSRRNSKISHNLCVNDLGHDMGGGGGYAALKEAVWNSVALLVM